MMRKNNLLNANFDDSTGNLVIERGRLNLNANLTRSLFLEECQNFIYPPAGGDEDFYFVDPVMLRSKNFLLSVSFRMHTEPYCTGYSLEPFELTLIEDRGASIYVSSKSDLIDFFEITSGSKPYLDPLSDRAIWYFAWGIVSIGARIQDRFRLLINIGWKRN